MTKPTPDDALAELDDTLRLRRRSLVILDRGMPELLKLQRRIQCLEVARELIAAMIAGQTASGDARSIQDTTVVPLDAERRRKAEREDQTG